MITFPQSQPPLLQPRPYLQQQVATDSLRAQGWAGTIMAWIDMKACDTSPSRLPTMLGSTSHIPLLLLHTESKGFCITLIPLLGQFLYFQAFFFDPLTMPWLLSRAENALPPQPGPPRAFIGTRCRRDTGECYSLHREGWLLY